ncbi:NAD(P)-dependent dehydrogenase (short-subunit alcohol dehydrogenase family) [Devosia sp. UYZn731]|uniref:SDR family oxidoreductase n=1 Tax=Devosia sp. UYZn731 TaxID=3156345 RepID=UPI003398174F
MCLAKKTALVVGGASGIGLAIAKMAKQMGAKVVVADRDNDASSGLDFRRLDVTELDQIATTINSIDTTYEGIDVLFNCAGVWGMEPLLEVTPAAFDRLFDVNVKGLFFVMQAVAKTMVSRARAGAIVNISSQAGRRGEADSPIYAATKASVISLTQSAALALVKSSIRVNSIAPGVVDTPMWKSVDDAFARRDGVEPGQKTKQVLAGIPIGRLATTDEIAAAAIYLASDQARYIIGQTLNVDGGSYLS